jgi:transposase
MLKYNILKSLGIQEDGWDVIDIKTYKGAIYFVIEETKGNHVCCTCGEVHETSHDKRSLHLYDWPWGGNQIFITVRYSRINCECVNYKHRKELFPFEGRYTRLTRRYETFVYYLLKKLMMTVSDVMRLTGLSYSTVYNIDVKGMQEDISIEPIGDLTAIGVDEVAFQKGHQYVTVISDIKRHGVVYVTTGNTKNSVSQFFTLLGEENCKRIETVVSDFHQPFIDAFAEYVPQAIVVGDRFHVAKMLTNAIDGIRKRLLVAEKVKGSKKKKISKSKLWVLRYRQENLKDYQLDDLKKIKETNLPLYEAYLLKEKFMDFFEITDRKEGENFLAAWIVDAYQANHAEFKEFADFIVRKKEMLLNFFKVDVAMGFCEGINNKIKVIKRMGYGYRNIEVFKLKIRQRCGLIRKDFIPQFYKFADIRLALLQNAKFQVANLY